MKLIAALIIGYLIGSVNISIIISKYGLKDDVRSHGSGNAGATNTARVFGMKYGVITFVCDFAKGVIACAAGRLLGAETGLALAGAACLIGHIFPVYFGFKGGKGVATGAALALMMDWRIFAAAIGMFIIVFILSRYVSLSSLCATITVGVTSLFFNPELSLKLLGLFAMVVVVFMHRSNIQRLANGTESRFKAK